ncbi:hypothetical protein [Geopsychrobacter electrodiphilus]|uniref:hypothetical protein n=1 Tax=Geopsychrobacter electrodiphilus TaxID=225196 RepID=UPI00035F9BD9|nr:hypothetical protein [Geopsychrobacter electrodiphilus]
MKTEEFINTATDPKAWCKKAKSLRQSADALWEIFTSELLKSIDKETRKQDEDKFDSAVNILRNCQFFYSLCAECLLKGIIIKNDPKSTSIIATIDGTGEFVSAQIKKLGNTQIDTHNLEKLAEVAGVIKQNENADTRELLAFSTVCIQWIGRYPVPLSTEANFTHRGKLPGKAFNHYYRDFMDPLLDELFAEIEC